MTDQPTTPTPLATYYKPNHIELPRRVWELPLAILLWTYIILGVLLALVFLLGGIGALA